MANYIYEEIISVNPAVTQRFHDAISGSSTFMKVLFGRAQAGKQMWPTYAEHSSAGSQYMGLKVQLSAQNSDSVSRDGQYTAMSYSPPTADGVFDFAKYNFSTARAGFQLGTRERDLMKNDANRFNAFQMESEACGNALVGEITDDLNSNTADSDGKLLGVEFAVDSGNTVGGINQASVAAWQSYENAVNGTLTTAHIVRLLSNTTRDHIKYGWQNPDVLVLSERTNSYLYSFLMNAITSNSFVPVNQDFTKYGVIGASFHGALLQSNSAISSGVVLGLNTTTWAVASRDAGFAPRAEEPTRVPKANVIDYLWSWSGSVGVGDCARNGKLTGALG